jgi:hypothetical protein
MASAHAPDPDRVAQVSTVLAGAEETLCVSSAAIAHVDGAGVVLIMHGQPLGTVCSSNATVEAIEEVQYSLGEGPCLDAFRTQEPVLIPDLAAKDLVRFPGFRDGALKAGVRAAFGFPMLVGSICIGALDLYQQRAGALSADQFADALAVAHVAGRTVLEWQSVAGKGSLARQLEHLHANRAVVHQAAGMVSVQTAANVDDALALLRAYAFSNNRPIHDVATDVVRRDLRLG